MKHLFLFVATLFYYSTIFAQDKTPTVYIDKSGVLRWKHTNQEASFYGVNYTVPFAHAYRALNYKGGNHKEAIDRDVYHMSRLGYNAYRIHIWDVEISDSTGNLLSNVHLDLLDYLFAKLEEKGIYSLVTMMTNFGNGYPERNVNTGAFTYLYDKCNVHAHPEAIKAQQKYISQLVNHKNPYNGKSYKNDPFIVGFEINNEPCHTGDIAITKNYVRSMVDALKSAGNKKPIFYNVSHNESHVSAYYQPGVEGTTYQWYPIGLVAGKERKGNFLPYVDRYPISFSGVKDFDKKTLAVYEYDPADILSSYIHPAMVRTFRSTGFQWITQFAYDPIDIAKYNTEYQTHFLNLAYTPSKAISTMIAAEVAFQIPRKQVYAPYPENTTFGDFTVNYDQDLSVLNDGVKYYYTRSHQITPKSEHTLRHVAGVGSSTLVNYHGTGAYFLDQLETGVWRLELMPDVEITSDPFEKPSLNKEIAAILWNNQPIEIRLQDLRADFLVQKINNGEQTVAKASSFSVSPGVYLLKDKNKSALNWNAQSKFKTGKLGDFYAPEPSTFTTPIVIHSAPQFIEKEKGADISMKVLSNTKIDSVILQTDQISFWRDKNPYLKLNKNGNQYTASLPQDILSKQDLAYTITVYTQDKKYTYPERKEGTPLDWDYISKNYYTSKVVSVSSPIILMDARIEKESSLEHYAIPDSSFLWVTKDDGDFTKPASWQYKLTGKDSQSRFFWKKYVRPTIEERSTGMQHVKKVVATLEVKDLKGTVQIGFITRKGFTYVKDINVSALKSDKVELSLQELSLVPTPILPAPYPVFLTRYFVPQVKEPFDVHEIEQVIISTSELPKGQADVRIGAIWLQ